MRSRSVAETQSIITRAQARDALRRSGYLLENRLLPVLEANGWSAAANVAYPDPITGKSRELDLRALRLISGDLPVPHSLLPELLIECVNNPQPVAFIQSVPKYPELYVKDVKFVGEPTLMLDGQLGHELSLEGYCQMQQYHHYTHGDFATQFCSFAKKSGRAEWLATHQDDHFDDIRKLCDAVDYFGAESEQHAARISAPYLWLGVLYPVIVLQGSLLLAVPTKRSVKLVSRDHIQFRRAVATSESHTRFHIDVVTERGLPALLTSIYKECVETVRRLASDANVFERSLARSREVRLSRSRPS